MTASRIFLLVAAVGLTPIALSYGLAPSSSLDYLFGLPIDSVNGRHIFRAIMGLYLALAGFWVGGAFSESLTRPALLSLVIFMLGLAAGRILSLVVDGPPHWLLWAYLGLEIAFGLVGLSLLRSRSRAVSSPQVDQ